MAQTNIRNRRTITTHEGAPTIPTSPRDALTRAVSACLLWEDQFYESGVTIADRITKLVEDIVTSDNNGVFVSGLAIHARKTLNLRHVPLLLCRELARLGQLQAVTLTSCIDRVDEITEFLALHPEGKKQRQVKKGIGRALNKFNRFQFGKYNRTDKAVTLKDAIFISHPKADTPDQQAIFDAIVEGKLESPDTWEVALSSGEDKKDAFTRLMVGNKLGAFAFIRNLRNMREAGVDDNVVLEYFDRLNNKGDAWDRILPFRFITAATHAPRFEPQLEKALFSSIADQPKLKGTTAIVVDRSVSMIGMKVSQHSELDRFDAAIALAMVANEMCENAQIYSFSNDCIEHPRRRGFALRDHIKAQQNHGTYLGAAIATASQDGCTRMIVITDEQSHDRVEHPGFTTKGDMISSYMVNVSSYDRAVGYGPWTHITGFSESILNYILEVEQT